MRPANLLASIVFASFALAGCVAPVESTEGDELTGEATAMLRASCTRDEVVGTYTAAAKTLTLAADGTYDLDTGIRCITTPCPSSDTGLWTLTRKGASAIVVLKSESGETTSFRVVPTATTPRLVSTKGPSLRFERVVVPTNPCAAVLCPTSSRCEVEDGEAQCVPLDVCAQVRCGFGTTCVATSEGAQCLTFECPTTEFVNCMPPVDAARQPLCSGAYHEWIRERCAAVEFVY